MLVTDGGMSTLANDLQSQKAQKPILVTDEGISTLANEVHPWKA